MGDLRLVLTQTRYQLLSVMRNRRAVVFSVVFPVVLLVLFNSIFAGETDTIEVAGTKVTAEAYFTGGMLAYAILLSAFTTLAIGLTTQRESGQLKRYRGTPVPSWTFLVAIVLRSVVMVALMSVLLLVIARVAYDVKTSGEGLAELVLYIALGTATMCVLGIAMTAVTTDVDTASAIAPIGAVLLSFISGVFVPVEELPGWLEEIGRVFPLFHLAEGVQTALGTTGDTGLDAGNVAVLGAWALGGLAISVRGFRWEPQAAAG